MNIRSIADIADLVQQDRISRKVFVDPEVFDLEMDRIFGRGWIYVGHDSEVKNVGDYICARIGRNPVVMTRHRDGEVYVLHNRCAHRGTKVVNAECGNAKRLQCMYHGWTYEMNGKLAGSPMQAEEAKNGFDFSNPALGMQRVPRVASIHGFMFASLAADGPSLEEYIGEARHPLDEFVLAAPAGKVEITGGCHRYQYQGNWKHQLENLTDTFHVTTTHASTVRSDGRQFKRRSGDDGGEAAFYDSEQRPVILNIGVTTYPGGHSSCESLFPEEQSGGVWDEYRKVLGEVRGDERARELLRQKIHNLTIFPNFDLLVVQSALRVIIPLSVDRTEVRIYPIKMLGAPERVFQEQIQYVNLTHSASSFVQSDDLEAFRRVQEGLENEAVDWCLATRGMGRERYTNTGVGTGNMTTEIGLRHHHQAWLQFMIQA